MSLQSLLDAAQTRKKEEIKSESLQALLETVKEKKKEDGNKNVTEERVKENLEDLRKMFALFREYPDLYVDLLLKENNPRNFKFFFYQRIFLRVVMRHRYAYATFPRAYSKSFLTMMALMLRAVLFPGSHLFVTTGGRLIFI